jgi:hypothetical protein
MMNETYKRRERISFTSLKRLWDSDSQVTNKCHLRQTTVLVKSYISFDDEDDPAGMLDTRIITKERDKQRNSRDVFTIWMMFISCFEIRSVIREASFNSHLHLYRQLFPCILFLLRFPCISGKRHLRRESFQESEGEATVTWIVRGLCINCGMHAFFCF